MGSNKIKWILSVSLVFFLILATNFIDRSNFTRVKDSIVNIYEDRLLAKGIVYDVSMLIHEKDIANKLVDTNFYKEKNIKINSSIDELLSGFKQTNITKDEKKTLDAFNENYSNVKILEQNPYANIDNLNTRISEIKTNLYDLSKIQIEEGRKQMFKGQKAIDSVELLTHMEVYLLIFLAIVIQILIIYNPKKNS
jgi:hypothetical protein